MQINPNQNAADLLQFVFLTTEAVMPAMMRVLNRAQISLAHFYLLWHLAAEGEKPGGVTMTDVARWRCFSTAASTGSIERMEKLGLAQREHAQDDRRKVHVYILDDGRKLIAEVEQAGRDALIAGLGERLERLKLPPSLFAALTSAVA